MTYFAVLYTYCDDRASLDQIRPQHRAFLTGLDEIVASGPLLGTDPGRALLLLRADSREILTALLDQDPFWKSELIVNRELHEWNPVVGVFKD